MAGALLAILLAAAASAAELCGPLRLRDRPLRLSRHAAERVLQRRVGCERLRAALRACRPFPYRHEKRDKLGCYHPPERLFVATADGVVLTVIAGVAPGYVERLRSRSE